MRSRSVDQKAGAPRSSPGTAPDERPPLFELARGSALNQIEIFRQFREQIEAISAQKFAAE
jgi:hypothetical protein